MNSKLYTGILHHTRFSPTRHVFDYRAYTLAVDLDELNEIAANSALFGTHKRAPLAIWEADYLPGRGDDPLKARVKALVQERQPDAQVARVVLVSTPRFFGYAFNPVSFFYCYDAQDALVSVVAQVRNTFGEAHLYVLDTAGASAEPGRARADKQFHVSPFYDRTGHYEFTFGPLEATLDITINLVRDTRPTLHARLTGEGETLTPRALRRVFFMHPLTALMTTPRILIQAATLSMRKRLPVFAKPAPSSDDTIRVAGPGLRDRIALRVFDRLLKNLSVGRLDVVMPDRSTRSYGTGPDEESQTLDVRDYRFFRRAVFGGDIGFGESYMLGEWRSEDLTGLLTLLLNNMETLRDRIRSSNLMKIANTLQHRARANTRAGSRKNIGEHYDLSNAFFESFLDPSMMYSCGIYPTPETTLSEAQVTKLEHMIQKAQIRAEHHVLEIGSGWGAFAIEMVRRTGCRVTTITVSKEQLALARERVEAAGLSDRIEVVYIDYRDVQGQFERIVSIEMLEAVGHEFLPDYFAQCDRLLAPGGRVVIQTITIPDERYEAYRRGSDWIRKHIFPGGHLPCPRALHEAVEQHTSLAFEVVEEIGPHYARTLGDWQTRFWDAREQIDELGFDDIFKRKWMFYFSYCAAGFATGQIGVQQFALVRTTEAAQAEASC